jgi:hypothetical protein
MKLHSDKITIDNIYAALLAAKNAGGVAKDVTFVVGHKSLSRSRQHGYEIQLGTLDKTSGPTRTRHYKNSGTNGAENVYAATYAEWGWFIAELFAIDPDATFGPYKGIDDFNTKTGFLFVLESA